jgi:cytochrome c biogenesis protein CcmG/thiol:disulfide interchange protein DsbE
MKLKQNEKIEIIGLNYKDKEKNAKKFLNELGDPYKKILSDSDGTISIEWGAYGVPESFLIHKNKVIKKIIGPLNDSSFKEIERLVK